MSTNSTLSLATARLIDNTRSVLHREGVTRGSLATIRDDLVELAQHPTLQQADAFPPRADGQGKMYQLHAEADGSLALYVNVCGAGVVSPPHDHATWAIIAGVAGVEHNTFYELDPQGRPMVAGARAVQAGDAIALMPDDIHSIDTRDESRVVCLHFYGVALPQQTQRRAFMDRNASHYAPQPEIVNWP